jgi:hypothetical protein
MIRMASHQSKERGRKMKLQATIHQPKSLHSVEMRDIRFFGSKRWNPECWKEYKEVATADIEIPDNKETPLREAIDQALDGIFQAGNGYRAKGIRYSRGEEATSVSVGDIIIIGEEAMMVDGFGFERVELIR